MEKKPKLAKLKFEEALSELEGVVEQLSGRDVDLEDSIKLYERGVQLKSHCEELLKAAEARIDRIKIDNSGEVISSQPLDGEDS